MAGQIYQIHVQGMEVSFPCRDNEFILAAMKRANCGPIHYGCFGGGCGVCKMRLVSGEVEITKRMSRAHVTPEQEQAGYLLICCAQPRSDLTVAQVSPISN